MNDDLVGRKGAPTALSFLFICAFAFDALTGCSSRASRHEPPQPIAECQQYEAALGKCLGHHYALPLAEPRVNKSDVEIAQMKQVCVLNMQRLNQACR